MDIETERLFLTPFSPDHLEGLHVLDRDPAVMRYIGSGATKTLDETREGIARAQARWAEFGFGWWAVFPRASQDLIGVACIQHVANDPANPIEVGWRLRPDQQGRGYASEAGRAALEFGFRVTQADEIIAVCYPENTASQNVMRRIGMTKRGIERHYDTDCMTYAIGREQVSLT